MILFIFSVTKLVLCVTGLGVGWIISALFPFSSIFAMTGLLAMKAGMMGAGVLKGSNLDTLRPSS